MADAPDRDRPSFTAFWKKSKEALRSKSIRFVESNPGADASEGSAEGECFLGVLAFLYFLEPIAHVISPGLVRCLASSRVR